MKQLAFRVTDGDHTRICSIGNLESLMDFGTVTDKETVEHMVRQYLELDEDLNHMQVFHFLNWCITFYNNYRDSGSIQVDIVELVPTTIEPEQEKE